MCRLIVYVLIHSDMCIQAICIHLKSVGSQIHTLTHLTNATKTVELYLYLPAKKHFLAHDTIAHW